MALSTLKGDEGHASYNVGAKIVRDILWAAHGEQLRAVHHIMKLPQTESQEVEFDKCVDLIMRNPCIPTIAVAG